MGALLALLALGGLFLVAGSKDENGFKETPEQKNALFEQLPGGNFLAYRPEVAAFLVNQLVAKKIKAQKQTPEGSTATMVQASGPVGPAESAYTAVKALHANGFNIWTSSKLHLPSKPGKEFKLFFNQGSLMPPSKFKGKLVLLWPADEPFPPAPGDVPPPQPPPPPVV